MQANHNVEQFVLGTVMADRKAASFIDMLTVEDFDAPHHQMIFMAISAMAQQGRHPKPIFLAPQFGTDLMGADGKTTLASYAKTLAAQKAVPLEALPDYVRELKEATARRMMSMLGAQLVEVAADPGMDVAAFLAESNISIAKALAGIRQNRATEFTFAEVLDGLLSDLRNGSEPRLVKTGLPRLDKILGGWPRGELTILAGRPGMGKTTLALSSMRQTAEQHGTVSHFFSLEMGKEAMGFRLISDAAWGSQSSIPYERIQRREIDEQHLERLLDIKARRVDPLPILIDDDSAVSMADIRARLERRQEALMRQGKRLDLVVADHLGCIRASDRYRGMRVQELGELTKAFKSILRDLDCAGILLSQLNRQTEQREEKRPMMSDLRESGNIEEDADTILFSYRFYYYLSNAGEAKTHEKEQQRQEMMQKYVHEMDLICGKRRNGPVFTHTCSAFMGSSAVRDLADNRLRVREDEWLDAN